MERDDIFQDDPTNRSPLALDQETLLDDQFRIGRVLGVGGFGITYLAFDEVLEMVVAVKEYLPNDIAVRKTDGDTIQPLSSSDEGEQGFEYGLERFLQEARTLAKFERHPNIVRVLLLVVGWWALSNEAPLAGPDQAITITEPVVLDVVANDRDPDQDPLHVQSVASLPDSVGRVEVVDSTRLRIEPAADFAGVARTRYVLADVPGDTTQSRVTLRVPFDGTQRPITQAAQRPQAVHAAPLDGDNLDVAIAALGTRAVGWAPNTEADAGRFDSLSVLDTSRNGAVDVHVADLTGNGRLDVLATSLRADSVNWYENRGDRAFAAAQPITTEADGPVAVETADVDDDGDPDVIVGALLEKRLLWYENQGEGRFGAGREVASGVRGLETLHVGNLDNDDVPDVMAVSYRDSTVTRYEPRRSEADSVRFESGPVLSMQRGGPIEVHAADVTGNGWDDVLVGLAGAPSVILLENRTDTTGALQFGEGRVLPTEVETVEGLGTGDVEGDDTLDVFAGAFDSDAVVWIENGGGRMLCGGAARRV